jgi:hypothetical protein|nr:MAG TPA: Protein of unknown function (DUF2570) [Caudoviricetes sp.]
MLLSTIFKTVESYRKYLYLILAALVLGLMVTVKLQSNRLQTITLEKEDAVKEASQLKTQLEREKQLNDDLMKVHSAFVQESAKVNSEMIALLKSSEKEEESVLKEYDVKPSDYTAQEKPWEKRISQSRISSIWQNYCLQHPNHEKCKPTEGEKK